MSRDPKFSTELHQLCGKLRDSEITEPESERLNVMLMESRSARRFYRTFMALASALETRSSVQDTVDAESEAENNIEVLFHELQDLDRQVPQPESIDEAMLFKPTARARREAKSRWGHAASLTGYILTQAAKTTLVKYAAAAAIAAALTLVAIVLIQNRGGQQLVSVHDWNDEPLAVGPLPVVATITQEVDAVWDRRPGEDLYSGQKFKLSQGFAEVTTARGAVALIQAPASIELLNNENALYLHAGKLVGICETESSKGFFVRTPHMDITDLGTRFGVDASRPDETTVKVFEGEVRADLTKPIGDLPTRQLLVAGDALAVQAGIGWNQADYEPSQFVQDLELVRYQPDFAGTNAIWLGAISGDVGQSKRKADALQVFLERRAHLLTHAVPVDFNQDHPWDPTSGSRRYDVMSGEHVDVYLLHFDLLSGHEQPEDIVVDFGRPILGVIVSQAGLNETDATLGVPDVKYPSFPNAENDVRGLNYRASNGDLDQAEVELSNDFASLSPDGTQLRLRLWGGRGKRFNKMDQVRVLVRASEFIHEP